MTLVGPTLRLPIEQTQSGHPRFAAAFRCDNEDCGELSIGQAELYSARSLSNSEAGEKIKEAQVAWTPNAVSRPRFPDVPTQIAEAASEAHACLSIRAHRGAVALARAVLEATAKDHGIVKGPLVAKIDELHAKGLIREITRQLAHEIREGGNEIAHGDLADEPMPPGDAQAIITLMDEILEEVYQGPARMLALKKNRLEREQRNADKKAAAQNGS